MGSQPRPSCENGGMGTGLPARRPHQFSPANFSAPLPMANLLGYYTALEQHPVYSMPIGPNQPSTVNQRRTEKNGTCFYCHQRGHWKAECPERQNECKVSQHQCRVREPICAFQWLAIVVFVCWTRAVTSPCYHVDWYPMCPCQTLKHGFMLLTGPLFP